MTEYKLKDLIKINNGRDYRHLNAGNIPVYGSGGIICYVDEKIYSGEAILLPRKGTLENIMYVNRSFWTVDTMYWAIVDENKAYPKYLYLYLKLLDLSPLNTGSTLPSMTNDTYNMIIVNLPDLQTQKEVADRVFRLISKIENNNAICADLEGMAKLLYDYWFVQFDFPDENGNPYKSSGGKMVWNEELKREIPEGWEISSISAIAPVVTGKEDANFSSPDGVYKFFTCSSDVLLCDTPAFSGNAVLVAGNGDFNVKHYSGSFNAYQRTYVLIPHSKDMYAVMYMAVLSQVSSLKRGANGSIVKFITKGDVENIPIFVQPNRTLYTQLNTILLSIEHYRDENEVLVSLRNFLLPMLMNGQVKVKGA